MSDFRKILPVVAIALSLTLGGCQRSLSRVTTVIRHTGSDTMVNLAQAWAEEYALIAPSVSVEVAGGGSATGIAALIDGTADIANSSRRMQPEELEAARKKSGGRVPLEWTVGFDALAVYVHPNNPLDCVTLEQLGHIYGRKDSVLSWSGLGVTIPGARSDQIILVSRQSNSGTYQYFRRTILGAKGDFQMGTRDLNGSKEVISLIGTTPNAIGFSGMGYATSEVKMLKVAKRKGDTAYAPNATNTISGAYPISRPLYIYSRGEPSKEVREFLEWIGSASGQKVVEKSGYVPVAGRRGD